MKYLLLLCVGCSGAPFTLDTVASEVAVSADDAGQPESGGADSRGPDVEGGLQDAPVLAEEQDASWDGSFKTHLDASADVATIPDAIVHEACVPIHPYTLMMPYCPASPCTQGCAEQNAPEYMFQIQSAGCAGVATPTACQGCGMYTCACVLANLPSSQTCGYMQPQPTCNNSTGMPTLVCP